MPRQNPRSPELGNLFVCWQLISLLTQLKQLSWKKWLVTFNTSKAKIVTYYYRRSNPKLSLTAMTGCYLMAAPCFDRRLGVKINPEFKPNSYVWYFAKDAAKWSIACTAPLSKWLYLLPSEKSQITPKIEYCFRIWTGTAQFSLSSPDSVEKRRHALVGDELFPTLKTPFS